MSRSPKFAASVIIPTYNREEMLYQNLRSLQASNIPKDDFEIIVVDDGSSDNTLDVVRNFTGGPQIRYVYQQDNGYRAGRARNLGIELAEGEVCILLDCGIVVSQGFVKAHIGAHAKPNQVVLGYLYGFSNTDDHAEELQAAIDALDLNDVDGTIGRLRETGRFSDLREKNYAACNDVMMDLPVPWAIAWSGNISVRREKLGDRFRFDENYRTWGAEDIDFSLSLFESGAEFSICRAACGIHLPHPKSHEVNSRSSRPNKIYLHSKFGRPETQHLIDVQSWELNAFLMNKRAASAA
ncbi:glycosyltransferase [Mesorhizobium sp. B2-4-13]|uniref:glycosyltransferase n=1 Tax=Mesorhizobium sp. B2-4-13 TaxID=2589936 RepID=UPI0011525A54|nr:glycosyltransferase [Mesorhizobium sp. B2-4-13]TPK80969.1 glycosyltransferase [Mesorhizobium sp. B2-4-13]